MANKRNSNAGDGDAGARDIPGNGSGEADAGGMPGRPARGAMGRAMTTPPGGGVRGGDGGDHARGRGPTRGDAPTDPTGGTPIGPPGGDIPVGAPRERRCGTMGVHKRLLARSQQYRQSRLLIEAVTRDLVVGRRGPRFSGVLRIPVVVHVVWNTATQNISDAQVHSQIDVLNRDFRGTNPDVSRVPEPFRPLVADSRIEFALASTDPAGNPTSGITRTQTNVAAFTDDDKVKSAASGGADAWPADRYLNLWVCQLGGGLLGYAQFPGGPAATDGVVILHSAFGDTGTATPPFHRGRTTTHEVGHYLNLYHIWGDDGSGCSGTDEVDDTPNQGSANTGVPAFPHVSCNNGPNGDLFVNYMDYVDDAVMVMFTKGQAARMEACLDQVRTTLAVAGQQTPRPAGPVVSWSPDRLDAFVLGTDRALYHKWWDGNTWGPSTTDYEFMGGVCMSRPEVVSWGPDRLDAFVLGTDRALYHKWWDGSAWGPSVTGYERLGGTCLGGPALASWGPDRLDAFVLGTDRALYHKWWDGSAWGPSISDYERLGGICISEPEVVAWGPDRLDVFVIGTDSALYYKWWDGTSWGPSAPDFEYLGGRCVGAPTVVAWGPDRLDVFVIGTDSALYHKWWDGTSWGPSPTDYEYLGGVCASRPAVVAWGPDRLDVFVVGTDSALYHKWWDGSAWGPSPTGYEYMGGVCVGDPQVVAWGPNRLDVFVEGTDSALYHKWWDGTAWGPSTTGYEYMGGVLSQFRVAPERETLIPEQARHLETTKADELLRSGD